VDWQRLKPADEALRAKLKDAITRSRGVVAVLTPAALESEWVP